MSAVTVVALPLLVAQGRDPDAGPPAVAAVGPATGLAGDLAAGRTATTEVPTTTAVAAGPSTSVIDIGVRAPLPATTDTGKAGFRRWVGGGTCSTAAAETGTRLTVTNLDNGQTVECVNARTDDLPAGYLVLLRTDVFERIGDLAQAPVPVRITW